MTIDPKELSAALASLDVGKAEQAKLEQTLGRSLLDRMSGEKANLLMTYEEIGGRDPIIRHVLSNMNDKFNELEVKPGVERLTGVINSDLTLVAARGGGSAKRAALTAQKDIRGQAAHTLARFASAKSMQAIGDT